MDHETEIAIIGAGVVGCAIACALARRDHDVVLLEAEAQVGTGITSRNSGVIHSGLYYPPNSRKARSCVRGQALLYRWCVLHDVPHRKTGKLVLAVDDDEVEQLHAMLDNALASGARGLEWLTSQQVASLEPSLPRMAAGLLCKDSGIVDAHALTQSLRVDAERHAAHCLTHARVTAIAREGAGFVLTTARGTLFACCVINAAGLHADEVARMVGHATRIFPWRGDYFRLRCTTRYRHLLYPVKPKHTPGLGVHLTLELDGGYRLGPDIEYRDSKIDVSPAEHKHATFLQAASRLLGPLSPDSLTYDGCGIRPKLRSPTDPHEHDFTFVEHPPRCLHLLGIESPGLTAALALAEEVAAWTRRS